MASVTADEVTTTTFGVRGTHGAFRYLRSQKQRPAKRRYHARKGLLWMGPKKHGLLSPSFLAAIAHHNCRTLSPGVTFLDAASIDPDPRVAVISGKLTGPQNLL